MSKSAPVTVIGDTFIDLMCTIPVMPTAGNAVWGTQLESTGGGSGANMALTLAGLEVPTQFFTTVGDDDYGQEVLIEYERGGVDTRGVVRKRGVATAAAVIFLDSNNERTIMAAADGSAVDFMTLEDLGPVLEKPPKYLLLSGLAVTADITGETLVSFVKQLSAKTIIFYDPNPRLPSSAITSDHIRRHQIIARRSNYLLSGQDELQMLDLQRQPGQILVVKNGAHGSEIFGDDIAYRVPAPPVTMVNATGAGDAFASGFVSTIARGGSLVSAVLRATAAGALAVQNSKSRGGITWEEILQLSGQIRAIPLH